MLTTYNTNDDTNIFFAWAWDMIDFRILFWFYLLDFEFTFSIMFVFNFDKIQLYRVSNLFYCRITFSYLHYKLIHIYEFFPVTWRIHKILYDPMINNSWYFRHINQFGLIQGDSIVWWKAGLGIAVATVAGFVVMRVLNTEKR